MAAVPLTVERAQRHRRRFHGDDETQLPTRPSSGDITSHSGGVVAGGHTMGIPEENL